MDFTMNRRNFVKAASLAGAASLAAGATAAFADEAPAVTPKYIFLFIGDGMGNEQVQITSFFKGATENDGAVVQSPLSFMGFPHVGSVTTYDSTSFCPRLRFHRDLHRHGQQDQVGHHQHGSRDPDPAF